MFSSILLHDDQAFADEVRKVSANPAFAEFSRRMEGFSPSQSLGVLIAASRASSSPGFVVNEADRASLDHARRAFRDVMVSTDLKHVTELRKTVVSLAASSSVPYEHLRDFPRKSNSDWDVSATTVVRDAGLRRHDDATREKMIRGFGQLSLVSQTSSSGGGERLRSTDAHHLLHDNASRKAVLGVK